MRSLPSTFHSFKCATFTLDKLSILVYYLYILVNKLKILVERIHQTMKVTASSNNLFQLTRLVAFNCYLVREDDGFTLIDTNMGGQAHAIMQEASKLGLPIVRILLTHAHVDHVGSLDALHEALPDVQVAISERDVRFLSGDKSLDPS